VNFSEARPCLQEFREEQARPSGLVGPVDLAALARLAASCFSEMVSLSEIQTFDSSFAQRVARRQDGLRNQRLQAIGKRSNILENRGERRGDADRRSGFCRSPKLSLRMNSYVRGFPVAAVESCGP
jgi:hypothetical protein